MKLTLAACRRRLRRGALVVALILPLQIAMLSEARAEPNLFERGQIETEALEAFRVILALWKEELYFELYDLGSETTRNRISREDFAQRMVELSWVPHGELNPKYLNSSFSFRTMVHVAARVQYRHKFNAAIEFHKDQSFILLEEEGVWRIDLVQLIRAPFV